MTARQIEAGRRAMTSESSVAVKYGLGFFQTNRSLKNRLKSDKEKVKAR